MAKVSEGDFEYEFSQRDWKILLAQGKKIARALRELKFRVLNRKEKR